MPRPLPCLLPFLLAAAACGSPGEEGGGGDPMGDSDAGPADIADADLPPAPDATDWNELFEEVLPDDHVVEIELQFPEGEWIAMLQEWSQTRTKNYHQADFGYDGDAHAGIGVRLKGYSSLLFGPNSADDKWPLKLNFDHFGAERFRSLVDRLNLGNNVFDPSLMRERLGSRLFEAMGVPVARTAYANVTVDGQYLGIYTMLQQVDKRFLKLHFGEDNGADDGNLYKCVPNETDTCTLKWKGGDPSLYHHTHSCNVGYEECGIVLKTNEEDPALNDYSDLVHFLDVLNNTPDEDFVNAIEEVFDVDSFLRFLAVNTALSSFDSYFGRVNNFYLYHRPDTDKFMMIPWDLNMTYGLYGCGGSDMVTFSIDDPICRGQAPDIPLADRILEVPSYFDTYQGYLREVAETHLAASVQGSWVNEFDALLESLIPQDPNYGGSLQQYKFSISDQTAFGNQYNLLDFARRRRAFILQQLAP